MLDNGDGAVRCGVSGFPSANIPANCSGSVTFSNKESQSTLPVKSYQLVIDSCSVIDQQSGEMEMHLALIVDGYKFYQTGFNYRHLPNEQAQLALPEWDVLPEPGTPVSLVSSEDEDRDPTVGVLYSNGVIRPLYLSSADPSQNILLDIDQIVVFVGDCGGVVTCPTIGIELLPDSVEGEFSTDSCSTTGVQDTITTKLELHVDGATFKTTNPVTGSWSQSSNAYRIRLYDPLELFELVE